MKTFLAIVVMGLVATVVLVAEVVRMFVAASPYLLVFVLVFGVLRARVRRSAFDREVPDPPKRQMAPARPVGTPPAGWVMVPVWMGPQRAHPPVIDAEVVDERRGPA